MLRDWENKYISNTALSCSSFDIFSSISGSESDFVFGYQKASYVQYLLKLVWLFQFQLSIFVATIFFKEMEKPVKINVALW